MATEIWSDAAVTELCVDEAVLAINAVDEQVNAFVAELGRASKPLPTAFSVDDARWIEARDRIEICAGKQDLKGTIDACIEYKKRATAYLDSWRKKLGLTASGQTAEANG